MTPSLRIDEIDIHIEGDGEHTIVMIHGWPDTWRVWDAQVAALKSQYRCVRFSLPGFDHSQPERPASVAEMARIFKNIVQQVSPTQPVTLMLHDWGCLFGYEFYMQNPHLVAHIIGVDIGDTSSPQYLNSIGIGSKLAIFAYQIWLLLAWRLRSGVGNAMTRLMIKLLKAPSHPEYQSAAMNYPYDMQWSGSFGGFKTLQQFQPTCPMLFVYGTQKPFMFHSRQWLEQLAQKPGSRVLALETDHWVMVNQPEAFNQAVLGWLRETNK